MRGKPLNFLLKNGLLLGLALIQLSIWDAPTATTHAPATTPVTTPAPVTTYAPYVSVLLLFVILRNLILCWGIEYFSRHRPYAIVNYTDPPEAFSGEFLLYMIQGSLLEITTQVASLYAIGNTASSYLRDLLTFIPLSLCVEVIFDFFHYWAHRFAHTIPLLYKLHRTHHSHYHIKPILAFYQNIVDMTISNMFPYALSIYITNSAYWLIFGISITRFQLALLYSYKIFIEIAGHSNRTSYPTCCFPQCIWLPQALGIELYSDDHNRHHSKVQGNYAKRFALWDRVFNTFIGDSFVM